MNKKVLFVVFSVLTIVSVLGYHLSMLVKISKMQRDIRTSQQRVSEVRKELQQKSSEFEEQIDFKKIRKRAEDDFGMEISDSIEYLRVD